MQLTCRILILAALVAPAFAADSPYSVVYSHQMEEPGNLEFALQQVIGNPKGGNVFLNELLELEYGVKAWWTTEVYLSGQRTSRESTVFTGVRWENRFRLLPREHWINPVLYLEYSNTNGADKSILEVVGHDSYLDQATPNDEARRETKREIEGKLILSSNFRGWNVSENIVAEKNIGGGEWEFGYAVGASRPLRLAATPDPCRWCRENFRAGLELYGGLGTRHSFGLHDTSHYLAPSVAWQIPGGPTLQVSPGFGLNENSHGFLLRVTMAYEIDQFAKLFRRAQ